MCCTGQLCTPDHSNNEHPTPIGTRFLCIRHRETEVHTRLNSAMISDTVLPNIFIDSFNYMCEVQALPIWYSFVLKLGMMALETMQWNFKW